MISKIKYLGILLGSIGYLMKAIGVSVGFVTGNYILTIGLILIAAYSLAKLIGKSNWFHNALKFERLMLSFILGEK